MGTEPIKLRGHHLRPLAVAYWRANENKELSDSQAKAYACLNDLVGNLERKMILIDGGRDLLCNVCKSSEKSLNGDATYINKIPCSNNGDDYVAGLIGLEIGPIYSVGDVLEAIRQNKYNSAFLSLEKVQVIS